MGGKSRPYDARALAIVEDRKNWVLGFLRQGGGSREGTAETDFEELVRAGCPEYALLGYLWLLRIVATEAVTTKDLTGLNPRGVRQVIGHLRKAAADLEALRGSTAIEAIEAILPWMGSVASLADSLSELARCLASRVPLSRGAQPGDSAIAGLLAFLEDYKCSDGQIASLIAAVTGREFYADALPPWRKRHARLLETARKNKLTYTS